MFKTLTTSKVINKFNYKLFKPTTLTNFKSISTTTTNLFNINNNSNNSSKMSFQYKQPEHKLTMIPGPIEFSDDVLASMATPSQAHTSQNSFLLSNQS